MRNATRILIFSILTAVSTTAVGPAQANCEDYYAKAGAIPGTPDCVRRCITGKKGMGTFTCGNRCNEFCGEVKEKPRSSSSPPRPQRPMTDQERLLQAQLERLRQTIRRTDAICSEEIRAKYLKLLDEVTLRVNPKITPGAYPVRVNYDTKVITFNWQGITREVRHGRPVPDVVHQRNIRRRLAHELRHLTPFNNDLFPDDRGLGYLTGRQGPGETDARRFADNIMRSKPDKGSICEF